MTRLRSWMALAVLLAVLVGTATWARGYFGCKTGPAPADGSCCDKAAGPKCCAAKEDACCADGKCCDSGECCCCKEKVKIKSVKIQTAAPTLIYVPVPTPWMPDPYYFEPPPPPAPPTYYPCPTPAAEPVAPPVPTLGSPPPSIIRNVSPAVGCGTGMTCPQACPSPPPAPSAFIPACRPTYATIMAAPDQPAKVEPAALTVKVVAEKSHSCLEISHGADRATFESMNLTMTGATSVKLSVAGKQVRIDGAFMEATADRMARTGSDGSVMLEGHVKVKYHKGGAVADVQADKVSVGLTDGRLEVRPCDEAKEKNEQVFDFWMGWGPFR